MATHALSPRRGLKPFFIAALMVFIIAQIVALTPAPLEQAVPQQGVAPESLTENDAALAPGIPKEIPEYSVDDFHYSSTYGGQKQWKILAAKAFLFNSQKLVHCREVTAYLYDSSGKTTVVRGREAKYFVNQRDLEIFGDVRTEMPDGFTARSEYLHYFPARLKLEVPEKYEVSGEGRQPGADQELLFNSLGFDYNLHTGRIWMPKAARMKVRRLGPRKSTTTGLPDETLIESDQCEVQREKQLATFTMYPSRKLDTRFVVITQPTMTIRARRSELSYGNYDQLLKYMTAYEDVTIRERPESAQAEQPLAKKGGPIPERYATAGQADFDTRRDVIRLTQFPQVYQDRDTVTGEVILVHRDSDLVEVEQGNAYSTGQFSE